MALTRDFKETVIKRVQRDPAFAKAMLDEAATLFLNGEPDTASVIVRDLVNATVGFETLAEATDRNSKSLHRMLSATGNPTMDNLAAISSEVRKLKVRLRDTPTARHRLGMGRRACSRRNGSKCERCQRSGPAGR